MLASPTIVAGALVTSVLVHTFSMLARIWLPIELVALIHIDSAVRADVSFSTSASVGIWSVRQGGAVATVSARVACTVVQFPVDLVCHHICLVLRLIVIVIVILCLIQLLPT